MSSRPESESPSHVSATSASPASLRPRIVILAVYTRHFTPDDRRSREWTEGNRLFQFYRGELDGARGRRPQRLPKIVVRASRQLGFMSPINSCDFADRFSDLESDRLPIPLSLSFSFSSSRSFTLFLSLDPGTLFPHRRIPAFRGFFPTHENESLPAAVSLLLIIK